MVKWPKQIVHLLLASALLMGGLSGTCQAQEDAESSSASGAYLAETETEDLSGEESELELYMDLSAGEYTDEKMEGLITQLQSSLSERSGSWSVYVCDLNNDVAGSINEHSMQAASLIKLYIMGAVYEDYDRIISQYGADNIDSNLYSMITVSDNDAANYLVSCLGQGDSSAGMQIVNSFCQDNGYTATHMGRLLLQSNEYDDNYTSAADCGHFLKEVYKGEDSRYSHAQEMFDLLAAQTRRHKIPAQLPEGVHAANKTGELSDVENDAAILYDTPCGNDLIIVFLSEYLPDVGYAQSTIASLARQIYDYYAQ